MSFANAFRGYLRRTGETLLTLAATGVVAWAQRSRASSPSDGNVLLTNAAGSDFYLLQLGGTTASFPGIKRNGSGISLRKADDSDYASFWATGVYAFSQLSAAGTTADAVRISGDGGDFRGGANSLYSWSDNASGASGSTDTSLSRAAAGIVGVTSAFEFPEIADPAAPAANKARLYTRDNGSGKTQLCVRFPTGAVQVLATEP